MKKTCFLHLGFHRTASTSFQMTCAANREFLAAAGIAYPLFDCVQSNLRRISNHSIPLYSLFCEDPAKYHLNIRRGLGDAAASNRSFKEQLEKELERAEKILLSGEAISLLGDRALAGFKEFLEARGFAVVPFALVRSPYEFVCSYLAQLVSGGRYRPEISFGRLTDSVTPRQTPHRIDEIKRIRGIFGNDASLFPFAEARADPAGPVGFLLRHIGLQNLSGVAFKRANESRGNAWVRLQNQINRRYPIFLEDRLNPNHFFLKQSLSERGKFLLAEEERGRMTDSLADIEEQTAEILGTRFLDDGHPVAADLSDDEILEIAIALAR